MYPVLVMVDSAVFVPFFLCVDSDMKALFGDDVA